MADIKTKVRGTVKTINKNINTSSRIKSNIISTKDKLENTYTTDGENETEYASNKVSNAVSIATTKGINSFNKYGSKAVKETVNNIDTSIARVQAFKNKVAKKKEQEFIDKKAKNITRSIKNKTLKNTPKTSSKFIKSTKTTRIKSIKTSKNVAIQTEKTAKATAKVVQKTAQKVKAAAEAMVKASKATIKAIVHAIKLIISATKALIMLLIAGGWISVIIILVIMLIAGFVAVVFNNDGNENFDSSQIPNSEIILVAKAQIGNEGGDKFWQWYGFKEHVHWCACYVSWCANECGYIDKGIIPKFALCTDGISWFKDKNQWHDRGESYYPIIGDIIFFDWKDESGNQDGTSDHVGIVTRTDLTSRNIYTIEGNTDNKCAERMYSLDDVQVMGYGTPKYE